MPDYKKDEDKRVIRKTIKLSSKELFLIEDYKTKKNDNRGITTIIRELALESLKKRK